MSSVIVLNRNYQFWTEVSLKKALKWFVANKIEVVVSHETESVGSIALKIKMPLVVRLLNFVGFKPKKEKIPFSANAVYERDNNFCQYWHYNDEGKRFKHKCTVQDRSIDHILPESRGGKNGFLNCICACKHCNERKKKNKTPKEAGLELIRKPFIPKRDIHSFVIMRFILNEKKYSHKVYSAWLKGG
jgi:5-methylcytosine-specific restriction endonuclease McrA